MKNKVLEFFRCTAHTLLFVLHLASKEDLKNYIKKLPDNEMRPSKKLVLLGNGPSLKAVLENWKENEIMKNADFLAVNYYCLDKTFVEIKPKYYVLSDPVFFAKESPEKDKVDAMYNALNNDAAWKMTLFVQYYVWKKIDWNIKISNKNIKVVPYHSLIYYGFRKLLMFFLKHGLSGGNYGTVMLHGEITGLNLGYKELYLYGVDHNFFENMCINKDNHLCIADNHFYDDTKMIPVGYYTLSGRKTPFTVAEYLNDKANIFHGHEIVNEYATYCQAKIYNCTPNSLIDAYERLITPPHPLYELFPNLVRNIYTAK